MNNLNRIKFSEISFKRIISAVERRILSIPNKILWNISPAAINNRSRLSAYKNKHQNERCYLIANGPSLKNTDLNKIKDKISFGLNRIYLNYSNMDFKPTYLVCVNKLVLMQFASELKTQTMPLFIHWQSREYYKDIQTPLYLEKNFLASPFSEDISYSINSAATVTYAALQIIYYMGFKEVIIIGMDHNFAFSGKPNETQIRNEEKDQNHFAENYFPKGYAWQTPDLTSTEYFYKIADQKFKKAGRKIYDATINGKCDVFEKIDYNSLF
jgi:hypothetical protein